MKTYLNFFLISFLVLSTCVGVAQNTTSIEEAKKFALGTNKLIVLDFWASWCGPCLKMDKDVWDKEEVSEIMANFIFAKIDLDNNRPLAGSYGVNSIPNILILDGNGKELTRNIGYMDLDKTINFLRPHALNTEYLATDALNFYKYKNYSTAIRLAIKNYEYSYYLETNQQNQFLNIGNEYLKEATKLLDSKDEKQKEIAELISVLELMEYAYSANFQKLEKKLAKINEGQVVNELAKNYLNFYHYLISLKNKNESEFLQNSNLEGFESLQRKADLLFKKHQVAITN